MNKTFSQNLKLARVISGLTQKALGEQLGLSRSRVSFWESNISEPNIDTLIKLSRILKMPMDVLLGNNIPVTGQISELVHEAHKTAVDHGWWEPPQREFGTLIALCHSELSEALEAYRHDDQINIVEELADTIIRIFDMCGHYKYPIEQAVIAKMEKNKSREYKHGGKKI